MNNVDGVIGGGVLTVRCDGPDCAHTVDVIPPLRAVEPRGWIYLRTTSSDGETEQRKHYCSRDCLADAVVP